MSRAIKVITIFCLFVFASFSPIAGTDFQGILEDSRGRFSPPLALGLPFSVEDQIEENLRFPTSSTFSTLGVDEIYSGYVGNSKDPEGLENDEYRWTFFQRNLTNYSYHSDKLDSYEAGWMDDQYLLTRGSEESSGEVLFGFVPCNRATQPNAKRWTLYSNYYDPYCENDGYESFGAILELFMYTKSTMEHRKYGTLTYENCGYTSAGFTSTQGSGRYFSTGFIDDFKVVGNTSSGVKLLISHRHTHNPDGGGGCDIMFNGTKLGELPQNHEYVLDYLEIDSYGNTSFQRIGSANSGGRIEFTLNPLYISYTLSPQYQIDCMSLSNLTTIGSISNSILFGKRVATNSNFSPYMELGQEPRTQGIIDVTTCSPVYNQTKHLFQEDYVNSPIFWKQKNGTHGMLARNTYSYNSNQEIPPFNLSIPLGEWYFAVLDHNGSLVGISKENSVSTNMPATRHSGIGMFHGSNQLTRLLPDSDGDIVADIFDIFPLNSSEWDDQDSDGVGDNSDGCANIYGNSTLDLAGCPDTDGDGVSNENDAFILQKSQQSDSDYDGFGDNLSGFEGDSCPFIAGISYRDRFGCPDKDGDGQSDDNDFWPDEPTQWNDSDGDGFGDNPFGYEGDDCILTAGTSHIDRFGCLDTDSDGVSDKNDAFPNNPTQTDDRDGDGYGDNQSENATQIDRFPSDTTQWNDTDGDGYGDNQNGNLPDRFPNDPNRWQDSDHDGVADEDDAFPDDATQDTDSDGDGYGDNAAGNRGDTFPNDPNEWDDTDGDDVGNNEDAFPFDPSQTTDADGDGFGDNPRGTGADKFPEDATQWSDIDGDGYGDNAEGTTPDAFIADPTQWSDVDGDGYGDNPTGRLADAFPNDPTQWEDLDGDGFGDNLSGNNPDPYLFDFDNDGYNDSIDPLPKLASPGDLDNDGVLDENDAFPEDYREWADADGDGEGDNADTDDDNDGWTDTDEVRQGTDPFSSSSQPIDGFEVIIPGTQVSLGAWDLIGIFGGVPVFIWIAIGFATRNGRTARYEEMLRGAESVDDLERISGMWEYSLMMRMLGPHQGIRLERLRADLEYEFLGHRRTSTLVDEYDQTEHVEKSLPELEQSVAHESMETEQAVQPGATNTLPTADTAAQRSDENGYEWFTTDDGTNFYRTVGSGAEWVKFEN